MNSTIQTGSMHEMLFEKRNKDYGAYVIRGAYNDTVLKSLVMVASALLLFIGSAYAYNNFFAEKPVLADKAPDQVYVSTPVDLNPLDPQKAPEIEKPHYTPKTQAIATMFNNDAKEDPEKKDLPIAPVASKGTEGDTLPGNPPIVGEPGGGGVTPAIIKVEVETPTVIAEVMPEFPGGVKALKEFFARNVVYPEMSKARGSEGTVFVSFIVGKDGKVTGCKVLKGVDDDCNEEAMRVVSKMPAWKPGRNGDKEVPVIFNIPIRFTLD